MHAPATPGTSDSGSAAGSDSEQGSGSNEQQTEKVTLTLICDNVYVTTPSGAGTYDKGSIVRIEAVASMEATDSSGIPTQYDFAQWSDGNAQRVRNIVLERDLTLTAKYTSSGLY